MEYDTVCPMYKQEHRHKHFGVGSLRLQRDELVQFFEGHCFSPQKMVQLFHNSWQAILKCFSNLIWSPTAFLFTQFPVVVFFVCYFFTFEC